MSSATITETARPPGLPTAPPPPDFAKPVLKPHKSAFKLLGEVLEHGGPGYLQFAITNICNAKCDFCGFAVDRFDPKQRRSVTLKEARDVIDIAVKNHIGYLLFVGGEPLVHKDLRAMVRYCAGVRCASDGLHKRLSLDRTEYARPGQRGDSAASSCPLTLTR